MEVVRSQLVKLSFLKNIRKPSLLNAMVEDHLALVEKNALEKFTKSLKEKNRGLREEIKASTAYYS